MAQVAKETLSRSEKKGNTIVALLKDRNMIQPKIYLNPIDKAIKGSFCFVSFPEKLSEQFRGSYISPETLLKELGEKGADEKVKKILSQTSSEDEHDSLLKIGESSDFKLTIWNGATSENALKMSELAAKKDYKTDEEARADFQNALVRNTYESIRSKYPHLRGQTLRIHDDCLASGDSIVSFLAMTLADDDQKRADVLRVHGLELVIDGPATAQGILFVKRFAEENGIKLRIDVGHLAFGLSGGTRGEGGVYKDANYITYPPDILEKLDQETAALLQTYSTKKNKNIYVVGDMGNAMRGISKAKMAEIRAKRKGANYCVWNDFREDPHGEHPNTKELLGPLRKHETDVETIYFPNGGYLPAELDRLFGPQFNESSQIFIDASRKWLKNMGYGAVFYEEGKKPKE